MTNDIKYKQSFCFKNEDFFDYGISPFAVLKVFNLASANHAQILGVGFDNMLKKKLLWVSMRIKFQVLKMPKPHQKLFVITYPSGKNMLEYDRDFLIVDEDDNILIKGMNKFCLINSQTRRVAKITDIDAPILNDQQPCFEGRFLKTETFQPQNLADYSYQILPDDIDVNGHTNNTIYAKVAQKLFEKETRKIQFFQINFLKETMSESRLDIYKKEIENGLNILGKICEGETSFSCYVEFK